MIVVVEGISASGKTTWCAGHGGGQAVAENGRAEGAPDRHDDPHAAARFWADRNVERWRAALAMESKAGLAVCDTDPLKLHYVWCLWQIGEATEADWRLELAATRETVARGQIGFADCYLVAVIDPGTARRRALADPTRRRRNFETHVRLQAPLLNWYSALELALPGRVRFGFASAMPAMPAMAATVGRYDIAAFDRMVGKLPRA